MKPQFNVGDEVLLVPRDGGFRYGLDHYAGYTGLIKNIYEINDPDDPICHDYEVVVLDSGDGWEYTFADYDLQPAAPQSNKQAKRLLRR